MIAIASHKGKTENILKKYPGAVICDVTSQAKDALVQLSPFYPHGDIPIPFTDGMTATCVEAVWQGLKVFEGQDVDAAIPSTWTQRFFKESCNSNHSKNS